MGGGGKTERWQGPGAQPPLIPVGGPDGSSVLPGAAGLGVLGSGLRAGTQWRSGGPANGKPGEPGLPEASCNPGGGKQAAAGLERKGLQKGRNKPRMYDAGWRRLLRLARDGAVTGMVTVSGRVRPGECCPDGRWRGCGFCGVPERARCKVHGACLWAGGYGIERGGLGYSGDRLSRGREEWVLATWSRALRRVPGAVGSTGAMRGCGALCRDVRGCNGLLRRLLGGLLVRDRRGQVSC